MRNRSHVILMLHTCQDFQMIFCHFIRRWESEIPHVRFLKIYFLSENSIQYIFIKLFPVPSFFLIFPTPYPLKCMLFLSFKQTKSHKKLDVICVGQLLRRDLAEGRLIYPGLFHWRNLPFPSSYHLGIASWLRVELYCPLPLLYPRILSGVNLFRSCAIFYSLCEIVCALLPWCLEDTVSLESTITSDSCNHSAPSSAQISEPWGEGCDEDNCSGRSTLQNLLPSVCCPVVGLLC